MDTRVSSSSRRARLRSIRGSPRTARAPRRSLPRWWLKPKEIEALTVEVRTLSYSSTKEAAEKILQLQRRRRELRAQFEAGEP
jgi:hypothetical protein